MIKCVNFDQPWISRIFPTQLASSFSLDLPWTRSLTGQRTTRCTAGPLVSAILIETVITYTDMIRALRWVQFDDPILKLNSTKVCFDKLCFETFCWFSFELT